MVPIVFLIVVFVVTLLIALGLVLVVTLVRSENAGTRRLGYTLFALGLAVPVVLFLLAATWTTTVSREREPAVAMDSSTTVAPARIVTAPGVTSSGVTSSGVTAPSPPGPPSVATALPGMTSAAWLPVVDQEFEADVYPSDVGALRSLGRRAAIDIQAAADAKESQPTKISIGGNFADEGQTAYRETRISRAMALTEVAGQLRAHVDRTTRVTVDSEGSDASDSPESDEYRVRVTLLDLQRVPLIDQDWSGTYQLQVTSPDGDVVDYLAKFIGKMWVDSLGEYQYQKADGRTRYVAKSQRFTSSSDAAGRQAIEEAIAFVSDHPNGDMITAGIRSGELIEDRFFQKLSLSYGDVWRGAILIDMTPSKIATMTQQTKVQKAKIVSTFAGRFLAFLAIMTAATVLYLLANSLTRGYYRGPIAVSVVCCIVAAILVIFFYRSGVTTSIEMAPTVRQGAELPTIEPLRPMR